MGNDILIGGRGKDTFSAVSGSDSVKDLGGSDVLIIGSGATASATVTAAWTATGTTNNAGTAALTTAGFAVNLAAAAGSAGFTVSNTAGATLLTGSAQADIIIGGIGSDTLIGGEGDDHLTGADGNDELSGGNGADSFILTELTGVDIIADFTSGTDHIALSKLAMAGLGPVGTLNVDAFWTGIAAHDTSDRVIYDSMTGALFYDADGNGSNTAVQIAVLGVHPALEYTDLLVF